jgi:hypothetical protein
MPKKFFGCAIQLQSPPFGCHLKGTARVKDPQRHLLCDAYIQLPLKLTAVISL